MSSNSYKILTAVKGHLLIEKVARPVHLALPLEPAYPFVFMTIEEVCPGIPLRSGYIQRCIRFKVSVYYLMSDMIEAGNVSHKIIKSLDGVELWFPQIKSANIRLSSCVSETSLGEKQVMAIHHLYNASILSAYK